MQTKPLLPFLIFTSTLAVAACGSGDAETSDSEMGISGNTSGNSETPTTGMPTTGVEPQTTETPTTGVDPQTTGNEPTTPTESSSATDNSGGFVEHTTGGEEVVPCDIFDLDSCPRGQKCAAYDSSGSGTWDKTKCVDIVGDPAQLDEPCVTSAVALGGDTCDKGLFCYGDIKCLEVCGGSVNVPICPEASTCLISNSDSVAFCSPDCNPIKPDDCSDKTASGDLCLVDGDHFICVYPGEALEPGEACQYGNDCVYGAYCAQAQLTSCQEGAFCCTSFCDVSQMGACPADLSCVAVWEQGTAPEGYENVGSCFVP